MTPSTSTSTSSAPPRAPIVLLVAPDSTLERAISVALRGAGVEVVRARTAEGASTLAGAFVHDAAVAIVASPSDPLIALAHESRVVTCAVVPAHHTDLPSIRAFDLVVPFDGDVGACVAMVRDAVAGARRSSTP